MNDCVFCKIAKKELPAKFVYEDEDVMVFSDIHPVKPIHLLIVPKEHIEDFLQLSNMGFLGKIGNVIKKVILEQGFSNVGYRLVVNGGGAQIINHLHIHLLGPMGKAAKM